ncbi:MAG: PAS domain S-box protein [Phycisphaerae bacterium]
MLSALQWAQIVSIAVAVLIMGFLRSSNEQHRAAVAEQFRQSSRLKMLAAKDHIEDYVEEIDLCLRLMSRYPQIMEETEEADEYLNAIYRANFSQHHLSEVYIIKAGFNGRHRPFKAFEHGDEEYDSEQHVLEREEEEYAVQVEHLRRFAQDSDLELLISAPVDLCVGETGRVLSVPIRSEDNKVIGIVAGMVAMNVISEQLEESSPKTNAVLLANEEGGLVGCTDFPTPMFSWFRDRFQEEGVTGFFENRDHNFYADKYAALWTDVDMPDDRAWRITFLYDEAGSLHASGIAGQLTGWGTTALVLLLGGSVFILCRVIRTVLITRKEAQAQAMALKDREGRLRSILDTAADAIVIIDEQGSIESFNASAEKLFGWRVDEILGKNVNVLVPTPDAERHDEYMRRYLTTGEAHIIGRGRDVVGQRKDGTTFPLYLAVSEVRVGERRLFTGIVRDVTKLREAEDTVRRHSEILEQTVRERTSELGAAKEKAEASNRAKSMFLANMSHELRTPLHAILSFAGFGIKEQGTSRPEDLLKYFESIHESGRTLMAVLNDILDLSKLESTAMTFDRKVVDLEELIQSVTLEFTSMACEKDITVRLPLFDHPIEVKVDVSRAKQVVRNLISNAVKFSPRGSTIVLEVRLNQGCVVVSVIDQGPGIPEDELTTVFDKFVQSSRTRTGAGGTGLGLAICRRIVAAHNGRIWAENNTGPGARLSFELPMVNGHGNDVPSLAVNADGEVYDA